MSDEVEHYMIVVEYEGVNYVSIPEIVRYCERTMENIARNHLGTPVPNEDMDAMLARVLAKGMHASLETIIARLKEADAKDAVVIRFERGGDDERDGDQPEGGV
jgi:hypothetical protein